MPRGGEALWQVIEQVDLRITVLAQALSRLDEDREQVVARLATAAAEVLDTLRRIQALSRIDGDMGEWTHKQFLTVSYDRSAKATLAAHARTVIDDVLAAESAPGDARRILLDILRAALGRKGLRIMMLKPNSALTHLPVALEQFKASDGQRLTAAIMLYCILARLRTEMAGRQRTGGPGMLWLDNPFGRANDTTLVGLQRRMADSLGVQLIYSTGIHDENAVGLLDRWNELTQMVDRHTGAKHVVGVAIGRTAANRARLATPAG